MLLLDVSTVVGRYSVYQCCGFRIQVRLRICKIPDPDHTHGIWKLLFFKPYNHSKRTIHQLPFSISHYSPTVQYYSPESSGLKIRNKMFSALSFLLDLDPGKISGFDRIWIHNTGLHLKMFN